jgi:hypothetical protein
MKSGGLGSGLAQKQLRARVKAGDRHQVGVVKAAQRLMFCRAIWSLSPIFGAQF